jgi:hypothetical protein
VQDWLETCFIVRKPGSALAQLTQQLSDEWTDEHDRLILKLLGSSEVGLGPLWTKDNRPVRKVNGTNGSHLQVRTPSADLPAKLAHLTAVYHPFAGISLGAASTQTSLPVPHP